MLDVQTTLLGIATAVNAGLFGIVYFGDRRSAINLSFACFVLCLSAWSLLHVGFRTVGSDRLAGDLLKISYVCALLIGASFYYFSIVFPDGKHPVKAHAVALVVVTLLFSVALLAPGFLTGPVTHEAYGRSVTLSLSAYLIFATVFLSLFLGGQIRIWRKYVSAEGVVRSQLLAIGTSVTTVGLIGVYFDLLLPSPFFENFEFVWNGPVLTSVFAVVITYAIFRFRLFSPKAALTELLVFAWWLFILVRALAARSLSDIVADLALLAVSVPIGVLLLRSIRLEARARETLAVANGRLSEADQMKSELLALATHQLRQPVTIIRSYASLLLEGSYGPLPSGIVEPVEHMLSSSTQMGNEITDHLSVAKLDQGRLRFVFAPTDLRKLIGDLVADMRSIAAKRRVSLIFDAPPDRSWVVDVDAGKISQVISNLIDNAIHYTAAGSVTLHLSECAGPDMVLISVQDTGAGIPASAMSHLFQRYSRLEDTTHLHAEGSGLGLYVAKQIVEGHGGRIWAVSPGPNQGATFSIELPVHRNAAPSGESRTSIREPAA
jgi:signal transduction histidine kinase